MATDLENVVNADLSDATLSKYSSDQLESLVTIFLGVVDLGVDYNTAMRGNIHPETPGYRAELAAVLRQVQMDAKDKLAIEESEKAFVDPVPAGSSWPAQYGPEGSSESADAAWAAYRAGQTESAFLASQQLIGDPLRLSKPTSKVPAWLKALGIGAVTMTVVMFVTTVGAKKKGR